MNNMFFDIQWMCSLKLWWYSFIDVNGVHVHCNTIHLDGFSRLPFLLVGPTGALVLGSVPYLKCRQVGCQLCPIFE